MAAFLARLFLPLALSFVAAAQPRSLLLEDLTWTELRAEVAAGRTTILVPIGGTEQNGPHMALGKHNRRAAVLAQRIAARLGNALVAPVVSYVPEGAIDPPTQHMRFPGTITIPADAFEKTLESAARSFRRHGFRHVVLLADHGGYVASLKRVAGKVEGVVYVEEYYRSASQGFAALLQAQGHTPAAIGEHAGLADTALTLAIAPEMVRRDRLGEARASGSGVRGDPSAATVEMGQKGVDLVVAQTAEAVRKATAPR